MNKKAIQAVLAGLSVLAIIIYALLAGRIKTNSQDVVVFGDSLVGNDRTENSVTALVAEMTGYRVFNAGIGGSLISEGPEGEARWNRYNMVNLSDAVAKGDFSSVLADIPSDYFDYITILDYVPGMIKDLSKINFSKVSFIVVEQGINDYLGAVDINEFENALRKTLMNLKKGAPKAQIIVVSPCYTNTAAGAGDVLDFGFGTTKDYVEAERRICAEENVKFVDFYYESGINEDNYGDYLYDGLHTNAAGNAILANLICEKIFE